MRTYACFVTDRRYSAPTLNFLFAADEAQACSLARQKLLESEHHRAVEVQEDGREVFSLSRENAAPVGAA